MYEKNNSKTRRINKKVLTCHYISLQSFRGKRQNKCPKLFLLLLTTRTLLTKSVDSMLHSVFGQRFGFPHHLATSMVWCWMGGCVRNGKYGT